MIPVTITVAFSTTVITIVSSMDIDVTKTTTMRLNLGGRLSDKREPNYNNGTYTKVEFLFRDIYSAVPFGGPGIVDGKWDWLGL